MKQGLLLKQRVQTAGSFTKFKSRVNRFKRWLAAEGLFEAPITSLTKKTVIRYLNEVLHQSSARNRNNTRTDLSSLFQVLEDNEWIPDNFVMKINVLKTVPVRHKSYTPDQETVILEYLEENDPVLLLFIYFIAYGFLRPIEVCRLKVKDLDLTDRKMYVKAKNSPVKIKLIPEILLATTA